MMTKEEKQELERQRCEGRLRCRELYGTICKLQDLLQSYSDKHSFWKRKAEEADRLLAEEEKLTKVPEGKSGKKQTVATSDLTINLTQDQIRKIAETLNITLHD